MFNFWRFFFLCFHLHRQPHRFWQRRQKQEVFSGWKISSLQQRPSRGLPVVRHPAFTWWSARTSLLFPEHPRSPGAGECHPLGSGRWQTPQLGSVKAGFDFFPGGDTEHAAHDGRGVGAGVGGHGTTRTARQRSVLQKLHFQTSVVSAFLFDFKSKNLPSQESSRKRVQWGLGWSRSRQPDNTNGVYSQSVSTWKD